MRDWVSALGWGIVSWAILGGMGAASFAQTAAPGAAAPVADPTALEPLLKQVDQAIDFNSRRYLVTDGAQPNSPWQIFHGILALRQNFLVKVGGEKVSAIDWVAKNEPQFDNRPLLVVTPHGANFHPFTRPYAFQGHPAQFLALLTQSNLPTTFEFKAQGKTVTIADMLEDTKMNVNATEEVTWILWALNHYYPTNTQWVNKSGQQWSIELLVQTQNQSVVENSACGGNHGLFALARARDKHLATGAPLRGVWLQADQKIKRYAAIAKSLQNADGTFSANSYKGPEFSSDINTRLNTTGHTLEFLAAAVSEQQLKEQWIRNAAYTLSKDLIDYRHAPVDCGPLYHSMNALMIYRDRVRAANAQLVLAKPVSDTKPAATTKPALDTRPRTAIIMPAPIEPPQWKPLDVPASALSPANR